MNLDREIRCEYLEFEFQCPKEWGALEQTDDEKVRFCNSCSKNVYHVDDYEDINDLVKQGKCIAVDTPRGGLLGTPLPPIYPILPDVAEIATKLDQILDRRYSRENNREIDIPRIINLKRELINRLRLVKVLLNENFNQEWFDELYEEYELDEVVMEIPKYDEIMPFALEYIARNGQQQFRDLEQPLASLMGVGEALIQQEYASGNGTIFLDRISWALSYLTMSGVLERPKRGHYQVTELGREYIGRPDDLVEYVKSTIANREQQKRANQINFPQDEAAKKIEDLTAFSENTPQELLNLSFENIRESVYESIIDTILSKTPHEFEKLVVRLLDRMGYGGQVNDALTVTQASNDGGIDGVIKEDVLGLGKIHIQAKRYARSNTVGREEVQKFVGALAVAQSNKGVFITTSSYSSGAVEYVKNLVGTTNIVLIDGSRLAKYIYDYGLGMQVEQVVEIKRMDADFWDEMADQTEG